jgi:hypothetical protein
MMTYFYVSMLFGFVSALRCSNDPPSEALVVFAYVFVLWPVLLFFESLFFVQAIIDRAYR